MRKKTNAEVKPKGIQPRTKNPKVSKMTMAQCNTRLNHLSEVGCTASVYYTQVAARLKSLIPAIRIIPLTKTCH